MSAKNQLDRIQLEIPQTKLNQQIDSRRQQLKIAAHGIIFRPS